MTQSHEVEGRESGAPAWNYPFPAVRGRFLGLAAAVLVVLWLARGVIGPFVVAAVLAYAFSPVVWAVQTRTRLPRVVVIAIGYVLVLGAIVGLAILAAERAGMELRDLSSGGPDVIETALRKVVGDNLAIAGQTVPVSDLAAQIRESLLGLVRTPSDAIHMAERAVDLALKTILCLIITFYFLLDGRRFGQFAMRFLDRPKRARTLHLTNRIHVVLGRWLRGQILLIALVAAVLYVILGPILHVPYALGIAVFSGVLEIVPLVGPLVAAALAGTVAFATRGTDVTIVVLIVFFVVRQIEDQVVMPLVIGRAVHLHPVVTIFAVLVGLSAWGVLGGLLGVPVAAALNVTLHELYPEETAGGDDEHHEGRRKARGGRWVRRPHREETPSQARPTSKVAAPTAGHVAVAASSAVPAALPSAGPTTSSARSGSKAAAKLAAPPAARPPAARPSAAAKPAPPTKPDGRTED